MVFVLDFTPVCIHVQWAKTGWHCSGSWVRDHCSPDLESKPLNPDKLWKKQALCFSASSKIKTEYRKGRAYCKQQLFRCRDVKAVATVARIHCRRNLFWVMSRYRPELIFGYKRPGARSSMWVFAKQVMLHSKTCVWSSSQRQVQIWVFFYSVCLATWVNWCRSNWDPFSLFVT